MIEYIQKLGEGQFGETWLANYKNQKVAVKKMKHASLLVDNEIKVMRSVLDECKKYSACLIDVVDDNIIMDYLPGVSLQSIINQIESKNRNVEILYPLKEGLIYLHSHNIAHQDIKPDNIMMTETGPKFIDFGLSCVVTTVEVYSQKLNYPCASAGSIGYAPAELFNFDKDGLILNEQNIPTIDQGMYPASFIFAHDIWSLGCSMLVYEYYNLNDNPLTMLYSLFPTYKHLLNEFTSQFMDRDPENRLLYYGENFDLLYVEKVKKRLQKFRCRHDLDQDCQLDISMASSYTSDTPLDDYY